MSHSRCAAVVPLEILRRYAQLSDIDSVSLIKEFCMRHGNVTRAVSAQRLQASVLAVDMGADSMPALWVYADSDGHWALRRQGVTQPFASRGAAIAFLRELVGNLPSYRLFIAKDDGHTVQDLRDPQQASGRA
jgi:hypothetical protein